MTSKRPEVIRRMFASIAHRYDLLNALLSAGADGCWRRQAVAALGLPAHAIILDVCTGTGKLAEQLRRRFPGAQVIGADFCPEMLSLARRKSNLPLPLVCADALCLPVKTSSCDLVTVGFGIRNFADLKAGLGEIYRCLRPGGAALFLEFFLPTSGFFSALYRFYLRRILPFVGETISATKGAYSYLRDSIAGFPVPERLSRRMREVGFCKVSYRLMTGGIVAIHQGWKEE